MYIYIYRHIFVRTLLTYIYIYHIYIYHVCVCDCVCVSLNEAGTLNNTHPALTAIQELDTSSKNPQTHRVTNHNRRHDAKAEEQFKHHAEKKTC